MADTETPAPATSESKTPEPQKNVFKDLLREVLVKVLVGAAAAAILAIPFKETIIYITDKFGPKQQVPIGAVVAYWGSIQPKPPDGYELCNGELVTTAGSPLLGTRKPNLIDSFVTGAVQDTKDVRDKYQPEGSNTRNFDHSHDAGSLTAKIGMHGGPSNFMSILSRGGEFHGTYQFTVEQPQNPGGNAQFGTAVDGTTTSVSGHTLDNIDIRPKHLALFYVIRVK
jgi:hypothetical protein